MFYKTGIQQLNSGTGPRPRSKKDELLLMGMGGGGTQYAYDDPMTSGQPMMDGDMPQQPNSGLLQALQELMMRMGGGGAQAAPGQMPPAPTPELQEPPMDEFGGASRKPGNTVQGNQRYGGMDTDENLPPEYAQDDKRAQTEKEMEDVSNKINGKMSPHGSDEQDPVRDQYEMAIQNNDHKTLKIMLDEGFIEPSEYEDAIEQMDPEEE